ncbi:hypothetical protein GMRT_11073 [Giardia muris]|uniref:Uncharacterized protein n=1 Tax=Giardia muris TaxID=5742 RepID=A0A4Z1SWL3_GIAMU|nr:hypothetical protein GMRT_11073 [Giardia muris]|eukprot:TNJ30126.1 hypothetical protein GMRT_11073 [Giardia muris]
MSLFSLAFGHQSNSLSLVSRRVVNAAAVLSIYSGERAGLTRTDATVAAVASVLHVPGVGPAQYMFRRLIQPFFSENTQIEALAKENTQVFIRYALVSERPEIYPFTPKVVVLILLGCSEMLLRESLTTVPTYFTIHGITPLNIRTIVLMYGFIVQSTDIADLPFEDYSTCLDGWLDTSQIRNHQNLRTQHYLATIALGISAFLLLGHSKQTRLLTRLNANPYQELVISFRRHGFVSRERQENSRYVVFLDVLEAYSQCLPKTTIQRVLLRFYTDLLTGMPLSLIDPCIRPYFYRDDGIPPGPLGSQVSRIVSLDPYEEEHLSQEGEREQHLAYPALVASKTDTNTFIRLCGDKAFSRESCDLISNVLNIICVPGINDVPELMDVTLPLGAVLVPAESQETLQGVVKHHVYLPFDQERVEIKPLTEILERLARLASTQ